MPRCSLRPSAPARSPALPWTTASRRRPAPPSARCVYASACRRSDQSCSLLHLTCQTLNGVGGRKPAHLESRRACAKGNVSPACLDDTGNLTAHRELPQLVPAEAELA